jgi:hypothetical protein
MPIQTPSLKPAPGPSVSPGIEVPFGVNEVRLSSRQWIGVLVIFAALLWLVPIGWEKAERFDTGPDYRIPYELSKDYWLYARRLRQVTDPGKIFVLGDSVIWGEYVLPDGTLSHFLNHQNGLTDRFLNGGLNGLFPLAQEGLVKHYAHGLNHHKVMVQCNVLWMTSPKADLSSDKEEQFNHSRLVPQFFPRVPCYKADANERLSAVVANHIDFIAWVGHLQNAYFGQKSIPSWTLEDDGGDPPHYPNAYKNPLAQLRFSVPEAPLDDAQRGPRSARHRPWTAAGQGTTRFDWVSSQSSLQWQAFQHVVATLRQRGCDLLVVVGPFNEYMIAEDNRAPYVRLRDDIVGWVKGNHIPCVVPELLPSDLYADASHPLTEGYKLLADRLFADKDFQAWLVK